MYRLVRGKTESMLERAADGVLRNLVKGRKRGAIEVEELPSLPPPPAHARAEKRKLSLTIVP